MATDKKLVRSKSGLKIVALDDNSKSPFLLPEPQWIPDNQVNMSAMEKSSFSTCHWVEVVEKDLF